MAQETSIGVEWEKQELRRVQAEILETLETAYKKAIEGLAYIKKHRLYRHDYSSFEAYCKAVFNKTQRSLNYQLKAYEIRNLLVTIGITEQQPSERSLRPLSRLEQLKEDLDLGEEEILDLKLAAYEKAKGASNKLPSGAKVNTVVDQILASQMQKGEYHNPYNLGEIAFIKKSDLPQNKSYVGCWGVVAKTAGRLCWLRVWDGTLVEVKPECLEPEQDLLWEKSQAIMARINQLTQAGSFDKEPAAWLFLEQLGRSPHPSWLSALEETILSSIEQNLMERCGVAQIA
jgi:hypothetical protein